MIAPSIDLMDGQAVQLVQGRRKVLEAGDPRPLAERFGRVGEVAVVDLDAVLGRGSNTAVIDELCAIAPCRVGGGIRDRDGALEWLAWQHVTLRNRSPPHWNTPGRAPWRPAAFTRR